MRPLLRAHAVLPADHPAASLNRLQRLRSAPGLRAARVGRMDRAEPRLLIVAAAAASAFVGMELASPRAPDLIVLSLVTVGVWVAVASPRVIFVAAVIIMAAPVTWGPHIGVIGGGLPIFAELVLLLAALPRLQGFHLRTLDVAVLAYAATPLLVSVAQGGAWHMLAPSIVFPYFAVRLFLHAHGDRVTDLIAPTIVWVGAAVAGYGIYESRTGRNPLVQWHRDPFFAPWGEPLVRDGLTRAQSTFGHPLALGCFLLLPIALCLTNDIKYRWPLFAILVAALVSTFSRGPWAGVAVLVLLLAWRSRDRVVRRRAALAVIGGVAAVWFLRPIHHVLAQTTSSSGELAGTYVYRQRLFGTVFHQLSVFGEPLAAPSSALSGFTDLSSVIATTATSAGIVGLLELGTLVAIVARAFLQADRDPLLAGFGVALLAMFVALITTPLITNFDHFFWLAMAVVAQRRSLLSASSTFEAKVRAPASFGPHAPEAIS
jgi:hypothetical protein